MRMRINETRCDHEAFCVDLPPTPALHFADDRNSITDDADVTLDSGSTGTVDDHAMTDH